jgi:hypothetical protein
VRGEGDGLARVSDPGSVRSCIEDGADVVLAQDLVAGADAAVEQVRQRLAVLFLVRVVPDRQRDLGLAPAGAEQTVWLLQEIDP